MVEKKTDTKPSTPPAETKPPVETPKPPAPPAKAKTVSDLNPGDEFSLGGELHRLVHVVEEGVYHIMRLKKVKNQVAKNKFVDHFIGVEAKDVSGDTPVEEVK